MTSFHQQSKAEWLKLVESELKGRSLDTIAQNIEGISLDPLYTADEMKQLPPIPWPRFSWRIVESFELSIDDAADMNAMLLNALNGGTQIIQLKVLSTTSPDWDSLFQGIDISLVDIEILGHEKILEDLRLYMDRAELSTESKQHIRLSPEWRVDEINEKYGAVSRLRQAIDLLSSMKSSHNQLLSFCADLPLIEMIAWIRSLKLICHHLLDTGVLKTLPYLRAYVAIDSFTEDLECIIERSVKALAPVLAGVDEMSIYPTWSNQLGLDELTQRRIVRNMHWILSEEAQLSGQIDWTAGSYMIEYLTEQFFEAAIR